MTDERDPPETVLDEKGTSRDGDDASNEPPSARDESSLEDASADFVEELDGDAESGEADGDEAMEDEAQLESGEYPSSDLASGEVESGSLGSGEVGPDDGFAGSFERYGDVGELDDPDERTDPGVERSSLTLGSWSAAFAHPRRNRFAGAVLGGAIGDAMGHPTEFVGSFAEIHSRWPPRGVEGYELWRSAGSTNVAPYTDDTQMAECVLRSLMRARTERLELDAAMTDLAQRFVQWANDPEGGHRAPGNACLAGCRALEEGAHWSTAGGPEAGGCGSVMRAYPFGLAFAGDVQRAERWAVAHSKLTHRDPIALAACAAMAVGVVRILRDEPVALVCSEMIAAAARYSARTGTMVARAYEEACDGTQPEVTLDRLRGWAAHEAIAAAVYLFARHPDDPRAAILEGANTPGDSDSLATLAGALVGARVGLSAIPEPWVRDIERRDALLALASDASDAFSR
ncbi:MAG: ADP-ribosylglycohydrolase family protein [Sandaracinaceae bacterium]